MDEVPGARSFGVPAATYDAFMGRYSSQLAPRFVAAAGVGPGDTVIDVGCGPGALTGHLVEVVGAPSVLACDPSPPFVEACAARHPGVTVRWGPAEAIPFDDGVADHAMAQLVLHFVSDPPVAAAEMVRVVRPGGTVSACVWDAEDGMEMLRGFWDAATSLDPDAPDEARTLRFGGPGEIVDLLRAAGLVDVVESTIDVASSYDSFDELWAGFLSGVGPAGTYCIGLDDESRERLRQATFERFGSPSRGFTVGARARSAFGRTPDR